MATLSIPIPKAGMTFEVDTDAIMDLPNDVLKEILFQGAKQVLNRGQTKHASVSKDAESPKKQAAQEAIMEVVEKTWNACKEGTIRITGGKAKTKGLDREIKVEAMRLGRLIVKDALKAAGKKVSHYAAKDITALAEEFLGTEGGAETLAQARATVEARKAKESAPTIDLSKIKEDAGLVEKAEKAAAAKKKPKAEGKMPPPKGKPAPAQHAGH